jgi:hypothetical protein
MDMSETASTQELLSVPEMLEQARRASGLDDFGDTPFLNALDILSASMKNDSNITPALYQRLHKQIVGLLVNRARLADDRKRTPGIAGVQIKRPILVVGFGRTGSTLIHSLLAEDPQHLAPRHWEVLRPSPAGLAKPDDARILAAAAEIRQMLTANPLVGVQHPYYITDGPQVTAECGHFLEMTFSSSYFWGYYGGDESYRSWLLSGEHGASAMAFHKQFLQHLQWGRDDGRTWVLKAPDHMQHLKAVTEVYPDARMIWTHRKPLTVLPSLASVTAIVRGVNMEVDRPTVAKASLKFQTDTLRRGLADRDKIDPKQFYDLNYRDLVADPIGSVRRIYDHWHIELTAGAEARMRAWLERNRQNQHGEHKYSLDELGMSAQQIESDYQAYSERFGV